MLRGSALAGMVVYHGVWDLHALALLHLDTDTLVWRWSGHAIAAAFFALSGLGLQLADDAGHGWREHGARLALLALASGLVTLGTWAVAPDAAVRFGILQALTITNAIALLLRRLSIRGLLCIGAFSLAAPLFWPWPLAPQWAWIGLSSDVPATLDFRPIFPWLCPVVVGLVVGRSSLVDRLAAVHVRRAVALVLGAAGRHSLLIYLLHQPVVGGALWLMAATMPGQASVPFLSPSEASAFLAACSQACVTSGGGDQLCRSTCHCVVTATALKTTRIDAALTQIRGVDTRIEKAVQACRAEKQPQH